MTRVGVLVSGSGTNLQALIDACAAGDVPARIAVVASDRHKAFGLQRARDAGIATEVVLKRDHPDRAAYDAAMVAALQRHEVEWVCLAGFMRLVTPTLLQAFPQRVLNIHPALLPAFPGLHAQDQAQAHQVRITGCTVHLVDEGTDTGPIVVQGAVPALPTDQAGDLQARILRMEHRIFPLALRWAVEGRLNVRGRRVTVAGVDHPFLMDPTP